jgi:hypothetical protein
MVRLLYGKTFIRLNSKLLAKLTRNGEKWKRVEVFLEGVMIAYLKK